MFSSLPPTRRAVATLLRRWCTSPPTSTQQTEALKGATPPPGDGKTASPPTTTEVTKENEKEKEKADTAPAAADEEKGIAEYPSSKELWEKYGVLSEMDGRHKHLTVQEFVALWWKLQELTKAGQTYDLWDIHTTAMHKDNWELNYQLLVSRLPPQVQELYRETFNKPYLSFRPPKMKALGMPPPQDYLDVWQAQQPTFYIRETWPQPFLYSLRSSIHNVLVGAGIPARRPPTGYCRLQLSHPITNDKPDPQVYKAKAQPGQIAKLLKGHEQALSPPTKRSWLRRVKVGETPNYLELPWVEIVQVTGEDAKVKVYNGPTRVEDDSGELVPSTDFKEEVVPLGDLLLGCDRLDYIPLQLPLRGSDAADVVRFLWPAPLSEETVKFLYSQEGYEYDWESPHEATHAADFDVNALLLPYEFVSKREPDLPNTLGKISVVVGEREYPIMVDFWDALKRFNEARRNLYQSIMQIIAGGALLYFFAWLLASFYKYVMVSRIVKPYAYEHLSEHPRYKYIYNPKFNKVADGAGPWAFEKK